MASWCQSLGDHYFILVGTKLKGRSKSHSNLLDVDKSNPKTKLILEGTDSHSTIASERTSNVVNVNNNNTNSFAQNPNPNPNATMTGILLTLVFLLGALSAVFITLWTADIITVNGSSSRKQTFQPLPQLQHLQLVNEMGYTVGGIGNSIFGIGIDPDGECEGDNPLGK